MAPREVRKRKLAELREHPRQPDIFSESSQIELQELADDMARRGQQEPVHILPDGTIIRGHRRVRAAGLLGWSEIDVVVRHDLATAGEDAQMDELLRDNLIRRRLDDLTLARCYRELKKIERRRGRNATSSSKDLRDRLAARLGTKLSGRQLDRLERLLDLPRPIQDAISRRELTKDHGRAILALPAANRQKIADALAAGKAAKSLVSEFALAPKACTQSPGEIAQDLLVLLAKHLPRLRKRIEDLDGLAVRGRNADKLIAEAAQFFGALKQRRESRPGQNDH